MAHPPDLESSEEQRATLDGMERDGVDQEASDDLDTAFHVAMVEASGNRLVADMTIALRDSMRRPILHALRRLGPDWEQVAGRLRADHRAVFAAIESGDGATAADRVDEDIRTAHAALPFPSHD